MDKILGRWKRGYERAPEDDASDLDATIKQPCLDGSRAIRACVFAFLGLILCSITVIELRVLTQARISVPTSHGACRNAPTRREWRSLLEEEKKEFSRSVNCLSTVPSRWKQNGTIYNDYTLLHGSIGSWSHGGASFLPWHRYTLFLWEKSLREHCGFSGQIPYWDWTLDWMNLSQSSIWDVNTGFGGDGDPNGPITVGNGRCVTDGPFKHLRPLIYNHTWGEHCLSRGFRDGDILGKLPSGPFNPETMGRVMRSATYKEFGDAVEFGLHDVMHNAISGDFLALTAANDPLFFVHHVQLDRLWWKWQQEEPGHRLTEYEGRHMVNSTSEDASLDSYLMYGGFADDIPVRNVIDTENGFLCYRY